VEYSCIRRWIRNQYTNTEGCTVAQVFWYCIRCLTRTRGGKCKGDDAWAFLFLQCQFVLKSSRTQFYNSPFTQIFGSSSFAFSSSSAHSGIISQRECKSQAAASLTFPTLFPLSQSTYADDFYVFLSDGSCSYCRVFADTTAVFSRWC
jgi:hypothetical protein